jgi:hypothetical protein
MQVSAQWRKFTLFSIQEYFAISFGERHMEKNPTIGFEISVQQRLNMVCCVFLWMVQRASRMGTICEVDKGQRWGSKYDWLM